MSKRKKTSGLRVNGPQDMGRSGRRLSLQGNFAKKTPAAQNPTKRQNVKRGSIEEKRRNASETFGAMLLSEWDYEAGMAELVYSHAPLASARGLVRRNVVSYSPVGERQMYDIEVAHPKHNFLLPNGIITSNSQTLLHFYPIDRRRLYNANKIAHKHRVLGAHNYGDISNELNTSGMLGDITVTPDEIASLMSAASTVSADSASSISEEQSVKVSVSRFAAPDEASPETQVEKAQLIGNLKEAMVDLSSYELKILQLKGVSLENLQ